MQHVQIERPAAAAALPRPVRLAVAVALGAALVALSAQVVIPLPFTPVPVTLQGLAVVLVGGVLGARAGAAALVTYLAVGMMGAPVFAGLSAGAAKLLGPTGGYLLAFPVAAAIAGAIARPGSVARSVAGAAAGLAMIFLGGACQLMILGATPAVAWATGVAPFLAGDAVELVIAGVVISRLRGPVQGRL